MNLGSLGKLLVIPILCIGLLITIKSIDYYTPDFATGFLSDKQAIFNGAYRFAFYSHIIFTPITLLIGTIQVFFNRNKAGGKLHPILGKMYVFLVLLICVPSGVIMSFYAFGGVLSVLSFLSLSLLLFLFTYNGFKAIISGNIAMHRKNIMRSYLLILSAILLRVFSFICVHYFKWYGASMYITIAWTSWLPSLIVYEIWYYKNIASKAA